MHCIGSADIVRYPRYVKLENTQRAQTSAEVKISWDSFFHWEETYVTPVVAVTAANINFPG